MLSQEYTMRDKMDHFETQTKNLIHELGTYSLIEFFHEEDRLEQKIKRLSQSLNDFNMYLPQTKVILQEENAKKALNDITVDVRERLNGYIVKLNHRFGLDNYDYVMNEVSDKTIRDIYKVLGPFDHYAYHDYDDELDAERTMKSEFEYRRSGAKYRGQINI